MAADVEPEASISHPSAPENSLFSRAVVLSWLPGYSGRSAGSIPPIGASTRQEAHQYDRSQGP